MSTLTIEEIVEQRGLKLVRELEKYRIPASAYANPPDGKAVATLSRSPGVPGQLLIWPGTTAEISIVGDRKLRQAVITIKEDERVVTASGHRSIWFTSHWTETEIKRRLNPSSYWTGPSIPTNGTKFSFKKIEESDTVDATYPRYVNIRYTIEAVVPESTERFLVGLDEVGLFISRLPRRDYASVQEAHEALRPKIVPEGALRQGEFFFVPVTKAEQAYIDKLPEERTNPALGSLTWETGLKAKGNTYVRRLEASSSHGATKAFSLPSAAVSKKFSKYPLVVSGTVLDSRVGRHKPLDLGDTWYHVVRNNELIEGGVTTTRRMD